MQVATTKLGLAAYMMRNGAKLIRKDGKQIVLETEKTEQEWRTGYKNTPEQLHNAVVMALLRIDE